MSGGLNVGSLCVFNLLFGAADRDLAEMLFNKSGCIVFVKNIPEPRSRKGNQKFKLDWKTIQMKCFCFYKV